MLEPLSSTLILFFFLHSFTSPRSSFNYKYAITLWRKLERGTLSIFYCAIVFSEYWKIKVKCFDKMSRLLVNFLPIFVVTSSWILEVVTVLEKSTVWISWSPNHLWLDDLEIMMMVLFIETKKALVCLRWRNWEFVSLHL